MTIDLERCGSYQVLLVENRPRILEEYHRQLGSFFDVALTDAPTQDEALDAVRTRAFDFAVVDIELDVPAGGYEVLRAIASVSPATRVVVATRHTDTAHVRDLLAVIGSTSLDVRAIIDKNEVSVGWLERHVQTHLSEWRSCAIDLEGLERFVDAFNERDRPKRIAGFRPSPETAVELDRIFRRMFGSVTALNEGARVVFTPITREGLSPAVTLEAQVLLGSDDAGSRVAGNRCVVKVGARAEIAEEARRYHQFVKFGVRLAHRVEMLSHISGNALSAICYSFAGGVFGEDVATLDELLRDDTREMLALATIERLFDPGGKEWYGVDAGRVPIAGFFRDTYETSFRQCYDRLDRSLTKYARRFSCISGYNAARESEDGSLEVAGVKLDIPAMNILGDSSFLAGVPACLTHGDMHGGNIMVELSDGPAVLRVCLIDYRSAGPGPRCLDAATLESSVRLADAERIARAIGSAPTSRLSERELDEAVAVAAKRTLGEIALGEQFWDLRESTPKGMGDPWQAAPWALVRGVRANFEGVDAAEYFSVCIACALRQMERELDPLARIRTLAWLSAIYGLLRKIA